MFAYKDTKVKGNGPADTSDIRDRMQKGYFKIGDDKNRKMNGDTTYTTGISAEKNNSSLSKGNDNRMHLHGSINLGTNQTEYLSEAKSKYIGKPGEGVELTKQ